MCYSLLLGPASNSKKEMNIVVERGGYVLRREMAGRMWYCALKRKVAGRMWYCALKRKVAGGMRYCALKRKVTAGICMTLLMGLVLMGCAAQDKKMYTSGIFAMDTIMELQVAGHEETLSVAEEIIRHLEKELSVTDENSEISRLNINGSAELTPDVAGIMEGALKVCRETDGALDISIYPVLKAWGFTTGEYRVPYSAELEELLKKVDYRNVAMSDAESAGGTDAGEGNAEGKEAGDNSEEKNVRYGENITGTGQNAAGDSSKKSLEGSEDSVTTETSVSAEILPGMEVDLGEYMKERGVTSALINLGGNVQCVGRKPNGERWKVAIKSPFEESKSGLFGVLLAEDTAIITSGGYERYFEENGEVYWHILDPSTGEPAKNGLASVTVVGSDGLRCDGLSTALFVMGLDRAIKFYRVSDGFDAIFITEGGEVYITEGLAGDFELSSEYYNAPVHILSK